VLHEHQLAHEEPSEEDGLVHVGIRILLPGQCDGARHRPPACFARAAVCRLHEARSPPVMIVKPARASKEPVSRTIRECGCSSFRWAEPKTVMHGRCPWNARIPRK